MSLTSASPPVLESVVFRHNSSPTTGGAIDATLLDSDLDLNGCVFDGNTAREGGGALHARLAPGRTLRISGSSFVENSTSDPGRTDSSSSGAISIEAGDRPSRTPDSIAT